MTLFYEIQHLSHISYSNIESTTSVSSSFSDGRSAANIIPIYTKFLCYVEFIVMFTSTILSLCFRMTEICYV